MSPRVRAIERALDALKEEDADRIADLVQRLQPPVPEFIASILRSEPPSTEDTQ